MQVNTFLRWAMFIRLQVVSFGVSENSGGVEVGKGAGLKRISRNPHLIVDYLKVLIKEEDWHN